MFPILFDFGTVDLPLLGQTHLFLPTYGFLFALGVLAAWWWFMRRARMMGFDGDKTFSLAFYSLLAGLLGAKAALILVEWRYYLNNPAEILGSLRIAGVLMGGVIAAVVVFVLYTRYHRLPTFKLLDAGVAPLALAQSVGRLGCFSAGCCWGRESSGPLSVVFTNPAASEQTGVPLNVGLVPTQLIQSANDILLAIVLTFLWRRRLRPDGTVFWVYLLLYSVSRGIIEFWRGDETRGLYFGDLVSTTQIVCAGGLILATFMIFLGRRRLREEAGS
jgi:phosphatidylglycerol:prolipoprotein diacylglycerol transferase